MIKVQTLRREKKYCIKIKGVLIKIKYPLSRVLKPI